MTTVYLKDHTAPAFLIPEVELDISLFEDNAVVRSKLAIERNRETAEPTAPLQLNIDELSVESVILNEVALSPDQYTLDKHQRKRLRPSLQWLRSCRQFCRLNLMKFLLWTYGQSVMELLNNRQTRVWGRKARPRLFEDAWRVSDCS